jgi:5-methylcytosine-specific restriction endonuclease McrA
MTDHRKPPLPPHFETAPLGTCRWCNVPIGNTARGKVSKARWHVKCVAEYKLLHWPTKTRQAVWRRDQGKCASCGTLCARKTSKKNPSDLPKWHMDHIKPLIESNGDISYWQMKNLQTLCSKCHTAKTSLEATERAAKRRAAKAKPDTPV